MGMVVNWKGPRKERPSERLCKVRILYGKHRKREEE
jgi:hypothetical protein